MPATATEWTVDMLDALPDDGRRYEIIDGVLYVTPAPREVHQLVVGELHARLLEYLRGSGVGKPIVSPADVRRSDHTKNRVQPDIFVVRVTDGKRPVYPYDLRDLLLAIEVPSPRNPRLDYQVKREVYLASGVAEYWVVNAEARNVSRWRRAADPGEIISKRIDWQPEGMAVPFVLELPAFFDEAFA